jgi:hypothetical protein
MASKQMWFTPELKRHVVELYRSGRSAMSLSGRFPLMGTTRFPGFGTT